MRAVQHWLALRCKVDADLTQFYTFRMGRATPTLHSGNLLWSPLLWLSGNLIAFGNLIANRGWLADHYCCCSDRLLLCHLVELVWAAASGSA